MSGSPLQRARDEPRGRSAQSGEIRRREVTLLERRGGKIAICENGTCQDHIENRGVVQTRAATVSTSEIDAGQLPSCELTRTQQFAVPCRVRRCVITHGRTSRRGPIAPATDDRTPTKSWLAPARGA